MAFRVGFDDPLITRRLKLLYLVPLAVIMYLPMVIYAGVREVGNPLAEIIEAWRGHE